MIARYIITTTEHVTAEGTTVDEMESRLAARLAEIKTHCHHGEQVTGHVEFLLSIGGRDYWCTVSS